LAVALFVVCGCEGRIPLPSLPQVEQASEVVQGGRLRSYQICTRTETGLPRLLDCMAGFGYEFLPRGSGYPAGECWQLRDAGGSELPPPQCFLRTRPAAPAPRAE
jgi:hypothetical protein